ncbi:hypothetical protein ASG90_20380 [Nocardioides sp. Soil797]|nr:hypothetical protein ASG90_20380 [Nocardioides sp. Soil797]
MSSRLRVAAVALGSLALLGLAACGTEDSNAAADAPKAEGCEAPPAADDAEGETRTISDTFLGDVKNVPTHPKRVVALWRTGSELADLCVVPVGALEAEFLEEEIDPERWADFDDIPTVGTYDGIDVEKILELEPDLIIGMDHGGLSINYKEIAEIVPTVILDIKEPTDVWDNYPQVADLVGRTTDYEESLADLDEDLAEVKDEFGDKVGDLEVTSLNYADQLYADTSKSLTWRRLDAAGFGYNPTYTKNPDRYVEPLAMENLPELNDQDIIFFEADNEGNATPEVQEVLDSASFKRLPAAKAGNVFPLATGTIYTFDAADEQLEDLRSAAENYQPAS